MTTTADWKAYGKTLKKVMRANVALVKDHPSFRCDWFSGGCHVAAKAILAVASGDMWGVFVEDERLVGSIGERSARLFHVFVRTPDGAGFIDAAGFVSPRGMRARFKFSAHRRVWLSPVTCVSDGRWRVRLDGSPDHVLCPMRPPTPLLAAACTARLESRLRAALPNGRYHGHFDHALAPAPQISEFAARFRAALKEGQRQPPGPDYHLVADFYRERMARPARSA